MSSRPLQRIIGAPTALLIGMGVAIGSGVFRSPGLVARELHDPGLILLAWALGGVIVLMQGMVTAELATRFPRAGGEYVFLREAYGEFVAFFFGWAYTIFIIGGGAAAIALAFGEFSCQWLSLSPDTWAGPTAAVAVVAVVAVNAAGLKVGAGFQNALTCVKALALLAIIVLGVLSNAESMDAGGQAATGAPAQSGASLFALFTAAITWALWPYEGTTDAVKMAEEVKDVRRALPRAVIGSALAVTVLYVLFNFALLRMLPAEEMARLEQAGEPFVPGVALARLGGSAGRSALLAVAIITCLGALSSTLLATIRVTFAMARDGLAFRSLARMSSAQAPVPAFF
jgi:APA family basic amino acid/polyamine antiporter